MDLLHPSLLVPVNTMNHVYIRTAVFSLSENNFLVIYLHPNKRGKFFVDLV